MLTIYSGFDSREILPYRVFCQSVYDTARNPEKVTIIPLIQQQLRNVELYYRPLDEKAATEFALTRFLVPHLQGYKGWALFVDGADMLFTQPVEDLFKLADDKYACMVVKHPEYTPSLQVKMDGMAQPSYPKKNWSSVILWNCAHAANRDIKRRLECGYPHIPDYPPSYFHQFKWLEVSYLLGEVGELPLDWNYLVGEYKSKADFEKEKGGPPANIHYTNGTPFFGGDRLKDDYADLWLKSMEKISDHNIFLGVEAPKLDTSAIHNGLGNKPEAPKNTILREDKDPRTHTRRI
jgi:lipopolysaccharide biosynthesis glycosyltransferase